MFFSGDTISKEDRTPKHLRASNLGDLEFSFSDNELNLLDNGVYIRLLGRFQKRHQKLDSDSLVLAGLPEGNYELSLLSQDDLTYFQGQIHIERGKTKKAHVFVAGKSHRSSHSLFDAVLSSGGGRREGTNTYFLPDWNYWEMADGTRRFFTDGQALEIKPDGAHIFLLDRDDDLLEDSLDPRQKNVIKPTGKDLLLGVVQRPFVTAMDFKEMGSDLKESWSPKKTCMQKLPPVGSLLLLSPKIHAAGGSQITSVSAHFYKEGTEVYSQALHDDGSLMDINPDWPQAQFSGDEISSDQKFSTLIPISSELRSRLNDGHFEIMALNARGLKSQVLHCRMPNDEEQSLNKQLGNWFYPKGFELEVTNTSVKIRMQEQHEVVVLTKNSKKSLFPRKNSLNLYEYSDSVSVQSGSLIFITVTDSDGSLFYTSERIVKR